MPKRVIWNDGSCRWASKLSRLREPKVFLHIDRTQSDTKVSPEEPTPRDQPISVMPTKQRKHESIFTTWTPDKGESERVALVVFGAMM